MKDKKTYMQKAYEKFAMMTKIQLETFLEAEGKGKKVIQGQIGVMKASHEGETRVCLVIVTEDGIIPCATFMSQFDCENVKHDIDSLDPLSSLFYSALKNDKRKKLEDFDGMVVMDEFKKYQPT